MTSAPFVRFVTRRSCELCATAARFVRSASRRLGVDVVELDVDDDAQLAAAFDERVPVVLDARDRVLAEGRIGRWRAHSALARVRLGALRSFRRRNR